MTVKHHLSRYAELPHARALPCPHLFFPHLLLTFAVTGWVSWAMARLGPWLLLIMFGSVLQSTFFPLTVRVVTLAEQGSTSLAKKHKKNTQRLTSQRLHQREKRKEVAILRHQGQNLITVSNVKEAKVINYDDAKDDIIFEKLLLQHEMRAKMASDSILENVEESEEERAAKILDSLKFHFCLGFER